MKKKTFLIAVAACLALAIFTSSLIKVRKVQTVMAVGSTVPKIIIDAGHGGMDGGAVGVNDVVEKDINLSIAQKLKEMLTLNGFDVIMIREDDRSIHDQGLTQVRMQKTSDMHNRLAVMQENPDAIFVSIHQNKYPESYPWGAQMFYSPNNAASQELAAVLQSNFKNYLQPENEREYKKAGNELFLLYNAPVPAVLVECGFLSNPEECAKLVTDEYQKDVAFVIFCSLMDFVRPPSVQQRV